MTPTPRSPSRRGFTMIELMLVISIIGVIASLAAPIFTSFIIRTKMTERSMMVIDIAKVVLEEASRKNAMPRDLGGGFSGINCLQNPPGAVGSDQRAWVRNQDDWQYVNFQPERRLRYRYTVSGVMGGGTGTLTITATSDLDNNSIPSVYSVTYTLNHSGTWDPSVPLELPSAAER